MICIPRCLPFYRRDLDYIMKKLRNAVILVAFSCIIFFYFISIQSIFPSLHYFKTLTPSCYNTTHELQKFNLKSSSQFWTLDTIRYYSADGVLKREEMYQLDKNGQGYYIAPTGIRIETPNLSWNALQSIPNLGSEQSVISEKRDQNERITYRIFSNLKFPSETTFVRWIYASDDIVRLNTLETLIITTYTTSEESQVLPLRDSELNKIQEKACYEIRNYDAFGNELTLQIYDDCYFKLNNKGYLQLIIIKQHDTFEIIRTDESGKPLWSAQYKRDTLELQGYTIWSYRFFHNIFIDG